jgi:hypothetical protein
MNNKICFPILSEVMLSLVSFSFFHFLFLEDVEELEVSEEQVQHMVEMGFSQDQVRHALQMSNNDVSMATNFLLQQN